jgi:hypothetical protein
MLGHQFAQSVAPIRQIKEVQFGILSPDEIVRIATLATSFIFSRRFNLALTQGAESVLGGKN